MENHKFLSWLHDRLIYVYRENPHTLSKPTCYVKLELINTSAEIFGWECGKIITQLHEIGFRTTYRETKKGSKK